MSSVVWWRKGDLPLKSPLAFDTETEMIQGNTIPKLSLFIASDGTRNVYVHPDTVADFLLAHRSHTWYGFNVSFDFWVVVNHVRDTSAKRVFWDLANVNKFICLRLLWRLVKLGTIGIPSREGTLGDACLEHTITPVPDKADPFRLRYGELIGLSIRQIEAHPEASGFLGYAIIDAIATHRLIEPLNARALNIMKAAGWGKTKNYTIRPDAIAKWGLLSVCLQTRADIVLTALSREPLLIDTVALRDATCKARELLERLADQIEAEVPGVWKRYSKSGLRNLNKNTGLPQMWEKPLVAKLEALAKEKGRPVLRTEKGDVSTSAKNWAEHVDTTLTRLWLQYETAKKRLSSMYLKMAEGRIFAQYEVLLKTGRTSASGYSRRKKKKKTAEGENEVTTNVPEVKIPSIPIQQAPRDKEFRKLFPADPGCLRLTVDYSYLELRTLAAVCEARFGYSKLAEAVRRHTEALHKGLKGVPDPHQWMAALSLGLPPAQYFALPKDQQADARQRAKVANFGLPGGLGVQRTIEYARNYKLELSRKEAKELKEQWYTAYPEMRDYLSDNTLANIAHNLRCTEADVTRRLGRNLFRIRDSIQGYMEREHAQPIIEGLLGICKNRELALYLSTFDYSQEAYGELADWVLTGVSTTLTGLVRSGVGFCDGANLPFQGLAAAGAKEALWRLMYAGYRVKAFIHDEILVDVPSAQIKTAKTRVIQIMNQAMVDVMGHNIPSACDAHTGATWIK